MKIRNIFRSKRAKSQSICVNSNRISESIVYNSDSGRMVILHAEHLPEYIDVYADNCTSTKCTARYILESVRDVE